MITPLTCGYLPNHHIIIIKTFPLIIVNISEVLAAKLVLMVEHTEFYQPITFAI